MTEVGATPSPPAHTESWSGGSRGVFTFALCVFGLAWLGTHIGSGAGAGVAAVWPVDSVVLLTLMRSPRRRWPGLLLVAILAQTATSLIPMSNWLAQLGLALCDALESLVAASALLWLVGPNIDLSKRRHLFTFGAVALVASFASGIPASMVYLLAHGAAVADSLANWVLGDALGLVIVTPALLAIRSGELKSLFSDRQRWRTAALLSCEVLMVAVAFLLNAPPLKALAFAALLLPAVELGMTGAAIGVLAGGATIVGLAAISSDLAHATPAVIQQHAFVLQIFLAIAAVVTLGLGATLADRRRLQAMMLEASHRFQVLTENASDLVLQAGLDQRINYISPSITKLLGYEPDEWIGRPAMDLVHEADAGVVLSVGQAIAAGNPEEFGCEYRIRHKDGRLIWFESRARLITDPETGVVLGLTDALRDISEHKALEIEMRLARDAAEAAALAKAEFLANMSHEIRTPLTAILGFARLIEDVEGLPATAVKYNERVITGGHTLLAVVNDILDFSKIEAGQLDLDPHTFDPIAFIEQTLELAAAQAAAKGLTLTCDIDAAMPAAVCADSSRIRQVLLNLIGNAVKFSDRGGVAVSASYLAGDSQHLKITVTDTGCGIPEDKIDRLFQRFSQVDGSISRTHGGTGLGLVICKTLTALMGGDIGVVSIEGHGSTFWFTVLAPTAELKASGLADAEPGEEDCAAARILIVDDVAANRELVSIMLSVFGHTLTQATNGHEAVAAALREPFDLILMDLQMPGMDGLAASRAIRGTSDVNRNTPIVALSANAMGSHIAECAAAGMNDHIAKPIDPATLLGKVALWISSEEDDEKTVEAA